MEAKFISLGKGILFTLIYFLMFAIALPAVTAGFFGFLSGLLNYRVSPYYYSFLTLFNDFIVPLAFIAIYRNKIKAALASDVPKLRFVNKIIIIGLIILIVVLLNVLRSYVTALFQLDIQNAYVIKFDIESLCLFVSICFSVPLLEELFFRGFLYKMMSEHFDHYMTSLSTSILFALIHANIIQIINAFVLGLFACYLRKKYSLRYSIILHVINNCLVFFILLLT